MNALKIVIPPIDSLLHGLNPVLREIIAVALSLTLGVHSLMLNFAMADENNAPTYTDLALQDLLELDVFRAASLLPTSHNKAPGTVYSFNREDFTRLGVRRLDDLLQFVPGIQVNQYRKRHGAIWGRGLIDRYNDKLVLMVDGVRMQHLYYGHFSLGDQLPLEKIENVEVIMGPASSLYGANAFGGIISVTTRGFSDELEIDTTVEIADNNRGKATFFYNSPSFQAFGSYLDQDAPFQDDRLSFIGGQTLQPLDETYRNLFLKGSPMEGLTLALDYQENDTPFLFIPDTQDAFIEERSLTISAFYESGEIDTGRIEAGVHYTDDNTRELEKEQITQTLGYLENQKSVTAGAKVTGFKRLNSDHVLALGAAWEYEHASDMDFERYFHFADGFLSPPRTGNLLTDPDISNDNFSLFIQDVWDISPELQLTLGGRYDDFEQFGDYFNYRGALVYSPNLRQTWKLLYGTAIRTPSFREYLKVLDGTNFIAPVPDPERIYSLELGYSQQWDKANLGVTFFRNSIDDYIREVPTPDGADEYFANSSGSWDMYGLDALLRYQLSNKLNLRLGAAYLDAEWDEPGELPYLASWSGSLGLDYALSPDHRIGLSLFYNDNRSDTNSFLKDDPENFILTNIYASGRINKELRYRVGIDNLTDKQIYDPAADFGGQHNTEKSEREIWLQIQWSPDL
jgi:outer membrane receptor for ferrienterochelin and colicin